MSLLTWRQIRHFLLSGLLAMKEQALLGCRKTHLSIFHQRAFLFQRSPRDLFLPPNNRRYVWSSLQDQREAIRKQLHGREWQVWMLKERRESDFSFIINERCCDCFEACGVMVVVCWTDFWPWLDGESVPLSPHAVLSGLVGHYIRLLFIGDTSYANNAAKGCTQIPELHPCSVHLC